MKPLINPHPTAQNNNHALTPALCTAAQANQAIHAPLSAHRRVVAPGSRALTTAPPFWPVVELGGGRCFGALSRNAMHKRGAPRCPLGTCVFGRDVRRSGGARCSALQKRRA
ncbi:unnamed protein product [Penicillium camemberti]|uniref:Str. FM013 n=1 Tax=Penicillium camemberti (strain FM 013) TaxID=1429867 RepID=A0A0G4NVX7_PENC3|nr:unnamed protein product [Penicillium camemberti]